MLAKHCCKAITVILDPFFHKYNTKSNGTFNIKSYSTYNIHFKQYIFTLCDACRRRVVPDWQSITSSSMSLFLGDVTPLHPYRFKWFITTSLKLILMYNILCVLIARGEELFPVGNPLRAAVCLSSWVLLSLPIDFFCTHNLKLFFLCITYSVCWLEEEKNGFQWSLHYEQQYVSLLGCCFHTAVSLHFVLINWNYQNIGHLSKLF